MVSTYCFDKTGVPFKTYFDTRLVEPFSILRKFKQNYFKTQIGLTSTKLGLFMRVIVTSWKY